MYIEAVPNRNSPPAILLRESYRVGSQIKKRTLLNLTHWPPEMVEGLRALLKGGTVLPPGQQVITIKRSLPHGHVAAILGSLRQIGLDRLLGPDDSRCRDLVIAMIVGRLIAPRSKLATAKALDPATAASSLGAVLAQLPRGATNFHRNRRPKFGQGIELIGATSDDLLLRRK
jgi:hypothetical protein